MGLAMPGCIITIGPRATPNTSWAGTRVTGGHGEGVNRKQGAVVLHVMLEGVTNQPVQGKGRRGGKNEYFDP